MPNQDLLNYIKQSKESGVPDGTIRQKLIEVGWQEADINEAFIAIGVSNIRSEAGDILQSSRFTSSISTKGLLNFFKTKTIIPLVLTGILITGGGAFGYFYVFQSPERITQRAFENLAKVKSFEYAGDIKMDSRGYNESQNTQLSNVLMNFSGIYDGHESNQPKTSFVFLIEMDALSFMSERFALGGEIRSVNSENYIMITDFPEITEPELQSISNIKNQWIKLDMQELQKQFQTDFSELKLQEAELTPERIKKISEATKKLRPALQKLSDEDINGKSARHYKFTVDKENLKNFIAVIFETFGAREPSSDYNKDIIDPIKKIEGEIWVGKNDTMPHKIRIRMEVEETGIVSKLDINLSLKKFDSVFQIEAPSEAKTWDEMFKLIFGVSFTESQQQARGNARDARRMSDIRQISTALELYRDDEGNGQYPADLSALSPRYLVNMPTDPRSGSSYVYTPIGSARNRYCVYAVIEDGNPNWPLVTGIGKTFYASEKGSGYDNGIQKTDCDPET